jgi:hypothetical protein
VKEAAIVEHTPSIDLQVPSIVAPLISFEQVKKQHG